MDVTATILWLSWIFLTWTLSKKEELTGRWRGNGLFWEKIILQSPDPNIFFSQNLNVCYMTSNKHLEKQLSMAWFPSKMRLTIYSLKIFWIWFVYFLYVFPGVPIKTTRVIPSVRNSNETVGILGTHLIRKLRHLQICDCSSNKENWKPASKWLFFFFNFPINHTVFA